MTFRHDFKYACGFYQSVEIILCRLLEFLTILFLLLVLIAVFLVFLVIVVLGLLLFHSGFAKHYGCSLSCSLGSLCSLFFFLLASWSECPTTGTRKE